MSPTRPFAHDETLSAIAEGLTRAELRHDVLSAARFRADLGQKLLLRGHVQAAQLHLSAARAVLSAQDQAVAASRVSAVLHQTLWMGVAPGVGLRRAA